MNVSYLKKKKIVLTEIYINRLSYKNNVACEENNMESQDQTNTRNRAFNQDIAFPVRKRNFNSLTHTESGRCNGFMVIVLDSRPSGVSRGQGTALCS